MRPDATPRWRSGEVEEDRARHSAENMAYRVNADPTCTRGNQSCVHARSSQKDGKKDCGRKRILPDKRREFRFLGREAKMNRVVSSRSIVYYKSSVSARCFVRAFSFLVHTLFFGPPVHSTVNLWPICAADYYVIMTLWCSTVSENLTRAGIMPVLRKP